MTYRSVKSDEKHRVPIRALVGLLLLVLCSSGLWAADAENCLMCHRYRGLSLVDKEGDYHLFHVDETLFGRGPHARVNCTGCHADITEIPHNDAEPVNCLRSCHIEEPTREIIFTHAKVEGTLADSVHAPVDANGAPRPHAEDYPGCKDCHDIPLFRPVSMFKTVRAGVSERAISRCMVCHQDEHFTRYYYSHVTTRMHKARDPREVVAMCSTCHADKALARRHGLPDVVSSYKETYHGKAVMFGSEKAPDCLDCHAQFGSVHEMHANTDERSSVHGMNRAVTCQTQDCHPGAAPALASFDVHANRDPKTHTLEFFVALFFVLMTLAIVLPILTLNVLGLIREIFPSREAHQEIERLTDIARKKGEAEGGIRRFTGFQRFQHAFLVVTFVTLALTGLPMKFPETAWAPVLFQLFGGIQGAPIVHRVAGILMLMGFVVHVVTILMGVTLSLASQRKLTPKAWIRAVLALPMIPTWQDAKNIIASTKYVLYLSPKRPNYGRFTWKEKLEYLGLFWGITLISVTGILLWGESLSSHVVPGWVLNICYLAHTYESFLAVAHITLIHIPGVLGRPGMSPLSSMVGNGTISPQMLAEEHGDEIINWDSVEEVVS